MLSSLVENLSEQYVNKVNKTILAQINSPVELVNNVCTHLIISGGKRIRPRLSILCGGAVADSWAGDSKIIDIASAIEMLHTATLMHDDVIDESELRRGQATTNVAYSNTLAVLGGDFLFTKAYLLAMRTETPAIYNELCRAISTLVEGEIEQMSNIADTKLSVDNYMKVIYAKTAILFEISAKLPAIIANQSLEVVQAFETYGKCIGNAFQIIDDILDYIADPKELGKNIGDDLTEEKITLPIILALEASNQSQQEIIKTAISNKDIDTLLHIINETKAIEQCYTFVEQEINKAISAIDILPKSQYKEALIELAHLSGKRIK